MPPLNDVLGDFFYKPLVGSEFRRFFNTKMYEALLLFVRRLFNVSMNRRGGTRDYTVMGMDDRDDNDGDGGVWCCMGFLMLMRAQYETARDEIRCELWYQVPYTTVRVRHGYQYVHNIMYVRR